MKITTKIIDYRKNNEGNYISDFQLSSWNDREMTYQQSKSFINMARNWANNFNRLFPDFVMDVTISEKKNEDSLIILFEIDYAPVIEEPDNPDEIVPSDPDIEEGGENNREENTDFNEE